MFGKGKSSSKANKADEELAKKLHEELNLGHVQDDNRKNREDSGSILPKEIQTILKSVQLFISEALSTTCCGCGKPLIQELSVPDWIEKWKSNGSKSATGCKCRCGVLTCLGCGEGAQLGNPKYIAEYEGIKLDYCCTKGALLVAWIVLCHYDNMELMLQGRNQQNQAAAKQMQASRGPSTGKGTGYGGSMLIMQSNPFAYDAIHSAVAADEGYRRRGLQQALNFRQADAETDGLTKWILGVLVELLPRRNNTTKRVNPIMASMIELSLLQDRVGELLRNDSLQDVDKRAYLYFAAFEFVGRLGANPKLDYLVTEDRFRKKQSAGLYTISLADCGGKGKEKAQSYLTVASRSEGMAASLVSCLTNLAKQSTVLISGSNQAAAGGNIREIAQTVNKLQTRLGGATARAAKITTLQEYHREHCLARKNNVAGYLCSHMARLAQQVNNPAKGRISRLVTEASEMTTSLAEGIFVRVDEDRPDIMKALIIGPDDTPYEGGLFEFDIVCGPQYPFAPPSVWFLTTGQGRVGFNPNLYATGKVCLSLIGTWPGAPESQWQPGVSTIASVLVSIQSMILWQWPYENEPGHEDAHSSRSPALRAACFNYNKEQRANTLKYATLEWLTRREMRDGLWGDVVRSYFRFCGGKVVESARRWEEESSGGLMGFGRGRGFAEALEMEVERMKGEKGVGVRTR
ncbi:MAG: hypothetical protein Q9219_006530 [cf. Caloplaca sp. 3 TL-2023]